MPPGAMYPVYISSVPHSPSYVSPVMAWSGGAEDGKGISSLLMFWPVWKLWENSLFVGKFSSKMHKLGPVLDLPTPERWKAKLTSSGGNVVLYAFLAGYGVEPRAQTRFRSWNSRENVSFRLLHKFAYFLGYLGCSCIPMHHPHYTYVFSSFYVSLKTSLSCVQSDVTELNRTDTV